MSPTSKGLASSSALHSFDTAVEFAARQACVTPPPGRPGQILAASWVHASSAAPPRPRPPPPGKPPPPRPPAAPPAGAPAAPPAGAPAPPRPAPRPPAPPGKAPGPPPFPAAPDKNHSIEPILPEVGGCACEKPGDAKSRAPRATEPARAKVRAFISWGLPYRADDELPAATVRQFPQGSYALTKGPRKFTRYLTQNAS